MTKTYYAVGEQKAKVKDEQGKEQTIQRPVLITAEVARSRDWNQRHIAQAEAEAYCKRNKITLHGIYLAKTPEDRNGVMTKGIKAQKAKAHQLQLRKRRAR